MKESRGTGFPWAAVLGTPPPIRTALEEIQMERCPPPTHNVPSPVFPHFLTRQLPATCELCKMSTSSVGLYKLKVTLEVGEIKLKKLKPTMLEVK